MQSTQSLKTSPAKKSPSAAVTKTAVTKSVAAPTETNDYSSGLPLFLDYEKAADQVAEAALHSSADRPPHQPKNSPAKHTSPLAVQPTSTGQPLPKPVRSRLEPLLNTDLSQVRVHGEPHDRRTTHRLNAKAFTHQNHIWLGQQQSANDIGLMAHEATHTLQQQSESPTPPIQRAPLTCEAPITEEDLAQCLPPDISLADVAQSGIFSEDSIFSEAGIFNNSPLFNPEPEEFVGPMLPPTERGLEPSPALASFPQPADTLSEVVMSEALPEASPLETATSTTTSTTTFVDTNTETASFSSAVEPELNQSIAESETTFTSEDPSLQSSSESVAQSSESPESPESSELTESTDETLSSEAETGLESSPATSASGAPDLTLPDLDSLATNDLSLIDTELAEHQRWQGAAATVGEAMSLDRALFALDSIGTGMGQGGASGLGMSVSLGLFQRGLQSQRLATALGSRVGTRITTDLAQVAAARTTARLGTRLGTRVAAQSAKFTPLPAIGAIIGGALSAYSLYSKWENKEAILQTISNFGEGTSTYEVLANSIASVSEVIDIVTNIMNVVAGIMGVITAAMWVAAVLSAGALSPLAGTLTALSLAIGIATTAVDIINAAILQPCVTLFRALHTFTQDADPREVVASGQALSQAAQANGAAVGGFAGSRASQIGGARPSQDPPASTQRADDIPTPALTTTGPRVGFEVPADAIATRTPAIPDSATATPATPTSAIPDSASLATPATSTTSAAPTTPAAPTSAIPDSGSLTSTPPSASTTGAPPTASTTPGLRSLTEPLRLEAWKESSPVPQGVEPGAVGHYDPRTSRADYQPHPFALESNPPGAAGASQRGGKMPPGVRQEAGVYAEHQTPASVAHEVLPGHEYHGPQGQRRGGHDTREALTVSLPDSVKPIKDRMDADLLTEVRARQASGEAVPVVEVVVRGAEHSQAAIAQAGADVPGYQVSKTFLGEMDQFHTSRHGYEEVPIGQPLPAGHPLRNISDAELGAFVDQTFDPFIARPQPSGQLSLPGFEPAPAAAPAVTTPRAEPSGQLLLPGFEPTSPRPVTPDLPAAPTSDAQLSLPFGPQQLSLPFDAPTPATSRLGRAGDRLLDFASSDLAQTANAARGVATLGLQADANPSAAPPSTAQMVGQTFLPMVFGPSGPGPSPAQQDAAHRAQFTADFQPIAGVERVNPAYTPPPATPAQIEAIRGHIQELQAARAQAAQAESQMIQQEALHTANQAPLAESVETASAGVQAGEQQQTEISTTEAANTQQQSRQQEAQGLIEDYPNQAPAIDGLRTPIRAFMGLAHLGSYLPSSAGEAMADMHQDSQDILNAFDQMDQSMSQQAETQPVQQASLQADADSLSTATDTASTTQVCLETAREDAQTIQADNDLTLQAAAEHRSDAAASGDRLDSDIAEQETTAATLAEQLRQWALEHQQARGHALAATQSRILAASLPVTGVTEL